MQIIELEYRSVILIVLSNYYALEDNLYLNNLQTKSKSLKIVSSLHCLQIKRINNRIFKPLVYKTYTRSHKRSLITKPLLSLAIQPNQVKLTLTHTKSSRNVYHILILPSSLIFIHLVSILFFTSLLSTIQLSSKINGAMEEYHMHTLSPYRTFAHLINFFFIYFSTIKL